MICKNNYCVINKWDLCQVCKAVTTLENQFYSLYQQLKEGKII